MTPLLVLLLFLHSPPASAALQAWLDRDRVAPGESVELTLQRDGRGDSAADLTPLHKDFDILGKASGSQVSVVNGRVSAQIQLRLVLAPKRDGKIQVPALTWDGERSPVLTLEVGGRGGKPADNAADNAGAADAHVFLTSTLAEQQPYLQAATPLKLRLYTDQPLFQASLTFAAGDDVLVQQLGKDRQFSETRNGRRYQIVERNYLLFPQRSGRISLPGPVLDAQVADARAGNPFGRNFGGNLGAPFAGMLGVTRPLRLRGESIVFDARPRPAEAVGKDWLPARALTLEESWRPAAGAIHAGEPITRQLRLSALGLSAAQLPDLAERMPLPDGIKAYPDQPRLNDAARDDTLSGSREQDIALIASRPGRYTLPALRLTWWDTARDRPREVVLPERALEVLPALAGASGDAPTTAAFPAEIPVEIPSTATAATGLPWPWISFGLGLLWLMTLAAWWWARRLRPRPLATLADVAVAVDPIATGIARKAFRQACRDNDAAAARRHLLAWSRANWPRDPPAGLNALARRLPDPALADLLRQLDRACYAGGEWRGQRLADALAALPGEQKRPGGKATPLDGLYP
jgi:hypothetical protein